MLSPSTLDQLIGGLFFARAGNPWRMGKFWNAAWKTSLVKMRLLAYMLLSAKDRRSYALATTAPTKEPMIASICLLSCALTLGQPTDRAEWQLSPQLTTGLELVYQGVYIDESLIPNVQHQRHYKLEANLLIVDFKDKHWHGAFMTVLSMQDSNKSLAGPMSVRLELANIDTEGRVRVDGKKLLEIPVTGPPTLECGFFVPAPLAKVGRNFTWDVADEGHPVCRWQVLGTETCAGVTCVKLAAVQQSADWDHPRADHTAWRRRDTLWIFPQLNVAQKVERIIERRDPARDLPTHRTIARYELESRLKYPGSMFEDRRQELLKAKKLHDDALALAKQPAQNRMQIDILLQRIANQLDRSTPTHYRKAFVHIKSMLESAKKGETLVPQVHVADSPMQHTVKALDVGQRAPDFYVSSLTEEQAFRLNSQLGKPVLVVFYNPATTTGIEVIRYAKQLTESTKGTVSVMAMAVTSDAEIARKQHRDMRLPFPVLDGQGMRMTFGAELTPRFVLLDGEGYVRLAQTGWGLQIPYEIQEALQRCGKK